MLPLRVVGIIVLAWLPQTVALAQLTSNEEASADEADVDEEADSNEATVNASTVEQARELHLAGMEAMAAGNRDGAIRSFRNALELGARASTALNLALVLQEDGQFVEAIALYRRLLAEEFGPLPVPEDNLHQYLDAAQTDQPQALISATGAETITILVDDNVVGSVGEGASLTVPLDRGEHVTRADAGDRSSPERAFQLSRSERRSIHLVVPPPIAVVDTTVTPSPASVELTEPLPQSDGDGSDVEWWVLGGVGVAVAVAATVVIVALTANQEEPFDEGPVPRLEALR